MATTMKAQGPTEAQMQIEQPERFRVESIGTKGEIVSRVRTEDPDRAMRAFVTLVDADKLKDRGAGSYAAITDDRLRLGGYVMSEGGGTTRFRFEKPEGAVLYEQTRAMMGTERVDAERARATPRQDTRAESPASVDADKRTVIAASLEARSSEGKARESTAGSLEGLRWSPVAIEVNETNDGKAGARFTTLRNVAPHAERSFASEAHTATRMSAETAMNGKPANELSVERPSAEIKGPARDDSPTKSAAAMKATMRDVQTDLDTGPRRSAIPPLEDRFNIVSRGLVSKDYEFRDQPGKIAFSESLLKLSSQTDSPAAAKAMVDRALERGWETVRVSGSSEFTRQAWIAATAHGIKAIGHTPTPGDRQAAEKERARVELSRSLRDAPGRQLAEPIKAQGGTVEHADPAGERVRRSLAIRERLLAAAFDKALRDGKVPANLRDQMRERMAAEGARRAGQGERFNVRVYDLKAPRAKPKTLNVGPQRVADRERAR